MGALSCHFSAQGGDESADLVEQQYSVWKDQHPVWSGLPPSPEGPVVGWGENWPGPSSDPSITSRSVPSLRPPSIWRRTASLEGQSRQRLCELEAVRGFSERQRCQVELSNLAMALAMRANSSPSVQLPHLALRQPIDHVKAKPALEAWSRGLADGPTLPTQVTVSSHPAGGLDHPGKSEQQHVLEPTILVAEGVWEVHILRGIEKRPVTPPTTASSAHSDSPVRPSSFEIKKTASRRHMKKPGNGSVGSGRPQQLVISDTPQSGGAWYAADRTSSTSPVQADESDCVGSDEFDRGGPGPRPGAESAAQGVRRADSTRQSVRISEPMLDAAIDYVFLKTQSNEASGAGNHATAAGSACVNRAFRTTTSSPLTRSGPPRLHPQRLRPMAHMVEDEMGIIFW